MPIEKDLKEAYEVLYEGKNPLKALEIYERILKQDSKNLYGHVYKSVCLEKLYFSESSWHNQETLDSANFYLEKAMEIAKLRGDRSKISFVNFRFSIHFFNAKQYDKAKQYITQAESLGYNDHTFPLWKHNIDEKYERWLSKHLGEKTPSHSDDGLKPEVVDANQISKENVTTQAPENISMMGSSNKFRTDWYQSQSNVTIVIFSDVLPVSESVITAEIDKCELTISFPIASGSSDFYYSLILNDEVESSPVAVNLFKRKLEITLKKKTNTQWKTLERHKGTTDQSISQVPQLNPSVSLSYPSSSKKSIDWSQFDLQSDEEGDSSGESADAFFQQLYKGADDDTKKAMLKSFIESNGTALNTNWSEVSKSKVEPALPEGVEMKKF